MIRLMNGKLCHASRSSASAPSQSWTLAVWMLTATSKPRVSVRTWRLRPHTLLASVIAGRVERSPPFDDSLRALAVDDRRRRAGVAARPLSHPDILRIMDSGERSGPVPQVEILPG